jgi:SAM-dependent methyltransferase
LAQEQVGTADGPSFRTDPLGRFTDRADSYARGRPEYPAAVAPAIAAETGLTAPFVVADIGSGTGISTRMLLAAGHEVFAVEPNAAMRAAAEAELSSNPRFHSVDGRDAATSLPDRSVDLVTAAQAFHWFDPEACRREWRRILREPPWVAVLSNDREPDPGLGAEYEEFVLRWGGEDYIRVKKSWDLRGSLEKLFQGSSWKTLSFPNAQRLDLGGLEARIVSSSYMPGPTSPKHAPMLAEAKKLFDTYEREGEIELAYETHVYVGRLA